MKKHLTAAIFALSIIIAAAILGNAIINRNKKSGTVDVTGLGEQNFSSDLVVWEGNFSRESYDIKDAYADLEKDRKAVTDYLVKKGINKDQIIFKAVNTNPRYQQNYNSSGNYMGQTFLGYELNQSLQIESKEVEKVEQISREITELLLQGVKFYSQPPRYYYTKLESLKIEMISKATEDARLRAERIAENSGSKLGKLISANMGIFQITGQNSAEDYSWGGTLNTSSKEKTASITMRLSYSVK
ncbi:SIMPL domain-containing protein [Belliella kenyensis]|uniref:SIMPL domain-containing protein n=1 Tax=Belliella kenyensis TaxID=1472724 RepID=A0ABV8EKZ0_9BACT|nr:SIMPL domain-containing protein [Belliella kenyensis]MCH7401426.1 SIMPL domain-containing protein [Belliella kenyensis]MDN3602869.1 SIMPL domain-containing protein [Belliella kenyensis]